MNLLPKLLVLCQAGQMPVRAGKERSQSVHESGVRMRREGNRDMGSCEVAVRLLLFKPPKPSQGQD